MTNTDSSGNIPEKMGVYIHIPFCKKKCSYCDFLSFLLPRDDRVADYVFALKKELVLWSERLEGARAVSVYIGGGTPSILPISYLHDIFRTVKKCFLPEVGCEFTVEANPGTLSRDKLEGMAAMGVNRLSLGVQAMDDRLLKGMGRVHTREQAGESVYLAREAGIKNIGVDLIYGLPGQALRDWTVTLERIIELEPEHISAYGLTLEANTEWGKKYACGDLVLPGEEECVAMYETCRGILSRAGYRQYEISNFAKPGYECLHNLGYWYRRPYIGAGLGASSFVCETRYRNDQDLERYIQTVAQGRLPLVEEESLSLFQAMSETMFLNLRTYRGVDIQQFRQQFGMDVYDAFGDRIQPLEETGILLHHGGRLKLDPRYYLLSNEVFQKFI